jgi:hypothetical protein
VEPVSPLTLTEKTLPLVPRIRNSRSSFFTLGARCASSRSPPQQLEVLVHHVLHLRPGQRLVPALIGEIHAAAALESAVARSLLLGTPGLLLGRVHVHRHLDALEEVVVALLLDDDRLDTVRRQLGAECLLSSPTEAQFRRSLPWPWHQNRV